MTLDGKAALVTGSASGIGRATALALARRGCHVAINYTRSEREAQATVQQAQALGVRTVLCRCDVSDDAGVRAMVATCERELGRLDVLVNAAGVAAFGPVAEAKAGDWDAMLLVNLRAVMVCCRAVLPAMMRQRSGTILNIASIAATRAIPGAAAYTATKAGVVGFSRVLAEELRSAGVRVGVLLPGAVDTPLWDAVGGGPDRAGMLQADDVARAAILMATLPPRAALEELTLLPAGGIL
jgi:NAD(P)-dependent dehydrogenase (short-subunit alcohol dehydrogenase family)